MGLLQYAWVLVLAPLVAGLLLVALGTRTPPRVGLGIAILANALSLAAAIGLATNILPDGPFLIRMLGIGDRGIIWRLDAFAAWVVIGLVGWATPVLIWMTFPRTNADHQRPTLAPTGWGLIAVALGLGAVLNDNLILIMLCWAGVGSVTWVLSRPNFQAAPVRDEWVDLALLTGGALVVTLALLTVMIPGKSLSLFDLGGRDVVGFGNGLLLVLVLAFAGGLYPFTLWVRRVSQGIMTDAVGVLALVLLPLALVLGSRLLPVIVSTTNVWPTWHAGPLTIPLHVIWLICGIATIAVAGLTILFERDLPVMTVMLGLVTLGWGFVALGLNEPHALLGIVLLLLAYFLGSGTLLAVWASCEWAERELDSAHLPDLAAHSSPHALAALLGGLTLVGFPLLAGFSGMVTTNVGLINLGGIAAFGAAIAWAGNGLALAGLVRTLRLAFTRTPAAETPSPLTLEGTALLLPLALLLVAGVAPELVLLGKVPGFAAQAAAALMAKGITLPDLTTSPLGFTVGAAPATVVWLPGIFWIVALGSTLIIALTTGLLGQRPAASPIFVGGEPPDPDFAEIPIDNWDDMAKVPQSPFVLPGPASWRDIGDREFWEDGQKHLDEGAPEADEDLVEVIEIDEEEIVADEAPSDDTPGDKPARRKAK